MIQTIELEDSLDYALENDDFLYHPETIFDILHNCIVPSLSSIWGTVLRLIFVNLFFGAIVSYGNLPQEAFHILSGLCGIYLVSSFGSEYGRYLILMFFAFTYVLFRISFIIQNRFSPVRKYGSKEMRYLGSSNLLRCSLISILVICQYLLFDPEVWMEIRGPIMIFSMKLISLAEDVDKGVILFPTIYRYFGYVFCGANIMFGPWISFQEYMVLYHHPTKKNLWWIFGAMRAAVTSLLFLIVSNCLASYLVLDDSNRWLVAYKDALSFRTSHYFICYLSETSMLSAGFKNHKVWYEDKVWRYVVTDPTEIEIPTALAIVVTNWNRPMHDFLKRYVYKSWLPLGKFYGILATFVVSSFLHGFEVKVSVVLISIGIFSYLQFSVQDYLARAFDCCIRVYPCKEVCNHKYKRNDIRCLCSRILFSFTSVLHLIYLGVIMDSSTDEIGIFAKWKNLYFCSFWIILFDILVIL